MIENSKLKSAILLASFKKEFIKVTFRPNFINLFLIIFQVQNEIMSPHSEPKDRKESHSPSIYIN